MELAAILPAAILGAVIGLDVVSFPQAMISRPLVAATVAGAFAGSISRGLTVGAVLELFALEMLAVGASRYPEWGTAGVVGGTLFASALLPASEGGALVAAVGVALLTAWIGGYSMFLGRRINGALARRNLPRLDRGSAGAVIGLQLSGLTTDLLRGGLLTALALLILGPLAGMVAMRWSLGTEITRVIVVGLAAAAAAGAVWRLFHGIGGARWWLAAGLALGLLLVAVLP